MRKNISLLQKVAWVYAVMFVGVFVISHWPGLTDTHGKLLGLFAIDPIDDIFHLLSGIYGATAAWRSAKAAKVYLLIMAFLYGVDALMGLLFSREFLNPTFLHGLGPVNFSTTNIYVNGPHILIAVVALLVVYGIKSSRDSVR